MTDFGRYREEFMPIRRMFRYELGESARDCGMLRDAMSDAKVVPVLMPQAGNTMEEGTILAWRVAVGEEVSLGQVLFEVETDKATLEVEAESAGRLAEIVVGEGETVAVKSPVAFLATSNEALADYASQRETSAESLAQAPPAATRRRASPVARNAASRLGVDLESMPQGSGPDGRILLEDVERAASKAPRSEPAAEVPARTGGTRSPMSRMRRAIGRNLQVSKQTVPHFYTKVTIDAGPLMEAVAKAKHSHPCSINDLVVLACARVVREMPEFRTQVDGDDLVTHEGVSIGVAVAHEEGLVVPVVRDADRLNLRGVARECRRVVAAAREGKLEGVGEAVFTVSNAGMHGVEEFTAIINPPESAILAVSAVREAAIVRGGALRIGKVMTCWLSTDHRVIDGVRAAKFSVRLKELLENPTMLGVL